MPVCNSEHFLCDDEKSSRICINRKGRCYEKCFCDDGKDSSVRLCFSACSKEIYSQPGV